VVEALTDLGIVKPRIIEHPGGTILIKDDEELTAENERLRVSW